MRNSAMLMAFSALLGGAFVFSGCGSRSNTETAQNTPATSEPANPSGSANRVALDPADSQFMQKAAQGGLAEVELGRLATEHASSPSVKQFGQRMVDDHSKANQELQQIASTKGVTLPQSLEEKDMTERDRLAKLTGRQFDVAYMRDMVKDHKEDVAEFRQESNDAKDPDIKSFASRTLPTLEEHLRLAENDQKHTRK